MRPFATLLLALAAAGCAAQPDSSADTTHDFLIAVQNDNVGKVSDYLKRGVNPNSRGEKGQTALNVAMKEQAGKSAKLLLAQPTIDVNQLNDAGESPLMLAAIKGDLPDAMALVDKGAKVNLSGWSPLHYAASNENPKMIQFLLDKGADINARSPNGTTPLMMAAQYGTEADVQMLLDRGADVHLRNQLKLDVVDFAKLSGRAPLVSKLQAVVH